MDITIFHQFKFKFINKTGKSEIRQKIQIRDRYKYVKGVLHPPLLHPGCFYIPSRSPIFSAELLTKVVSSFKICSFSSNFIILSTREAAFNSLHKRSSKLLICLDFKSGSSKEQQEKRRRSLLLLWEASKYSEDRLL